MHFSLLDVTGWGGQFPSSYPSSLRSAYWLAGHRNQNFAPTSPPHVLVCRYTGENEGSMLLVTEAHFVPHLPSNRPLDNSAQGGRHSCARHHPKQLGHHLLLSAAAPAVVRREHTGVRPTAGEVASPRKGRRQRGVAGAGTNRSWSDTRRAKALWGASCLLLQLHGDFQPSCLLLFPEWGLPGKTRR